MKTKTFYNLLLICDRLICKYIGFTEPEKTIPIKVSLINGELRVKNLTSYKRHIIDEPWWQFNTCSSTSVRDRDLQKLGIAAGKAISKNLIISFEKSELQ